MNRPILGITMGDPAGCGPEITVRALSDATVYQRCRPLVIGDIKCIRDALRVTNRSELKLHQVDRPSQGLYEFGTNVFEVRFKYKTQILVGLQKSKTCILVS